MLHAKAHKPVASSKDSAMRMGWFGEATPRTTAHRKTPTASVATLQLGRDDFHTADATTHVPITTVSKPASITKIAGPNRRSLASSRASVRLSRRACSQMDWSPKASAPKNATVSPAPIVLRRKPAYARFWLLA